MNHNYICKNAEIDRWWCTWALMVGTWGIPHCRLRLRSMNMNSFSSETLNHFFRDFSYCRRMITHDVSRLQSGFFDKVRPTRNFPVLLWSVMKQPLHVKMVLSRQNTRKNISGIDKPHGTRPRAAQELFSVTFLVGYRDRQFNRPMHLTTSAARLQVNPIYSWGSFKNA